MPVVMLFGSGIPLLVQTPEVQVGEVQVGQQLVVLLQQPCLKQEEQALVL